MLLAVICSLARYGLHYSHWTDVACGFALGLIFGIYMVLYRARIICDLCLFIQSRTQLFIDNEYSLEKLLFMGATGFRLQDLKWKLHELKRINIFFKKMNMIIPE